MTRRKDKLADLWQLYINQPQTPSQITLTYVAALKARVDTLEIEVALLKSELRKTRGEKSNE
jgi:hypothetical protein